MVSLLGKQRLTLLDRVCHNPSYKGVKEVTIFS